MISPIRKWTNRKATASCQHLPSLRTQVNGRSCEPNLKITISGEIQMIGISCWESLKQPPSVLSNICGLDIPELIDNGQMRPFWLAAVAQVVMYHPFMIEDFGDDDPVCKRVVGAAKAAKISDPRLPASASSTTVLLFWAELLWKKYCELNVDSPPADANVLAQSKFVAERIEKNIEMTGENRDRVGELDGRVKSLEQNNVRLSTALEKSEARLERSEAREAILVELCSTLIGVIQDNPGMVSPTKRKAIEATITGLSSSNNKRIAVAADPNTNDMPRAVTVAHSESVVQPVKETMASKDATNADPKVAASAANAGVKDIIYERYVAGHFFEKPDPMCLLDVPCGPPHLFKENAKFNYSMKVMAIGFDTEGWAGVNGEYKTKEAKEKAETVITLASQKALEAMLRLEYDAGIKDPSNPKEGSRTPSATVTALGERFRLWEKKVGLKADSLYDARLEESGYKSKAKQTSVRSFFAKTKAAIHSTVTAVASTVSPVKSPKPKSGKENEMSRSTQGVTNPYSKGKTN